MILVGGVILALVVIALVFALTHDYAAPITGTGDMKAADQDARGLSYNDDGGSRPGS